MSANAKSEEDENSIRVSRMPETLLQIQPIESPLQSQKIHHPKIDDFYIKYRYHHRTLSPTITPPAILKGNRKTRKQTLKLKKYEQYKLIVTNPDFFYLEDVSSADVLFENSKKLRDSVYIPGYWKRGRVFLGEKGYRKVPYVLSQNVLDTGILASQAGNDIKIGGRDKIYPKMGLKNVSQKIKTKIVQNNEGIVFDQLLRDCFFKNQQKPIYRRIGELFSPNAENKKEFDKKPGVLSDELRVALGMGADSDVPWLMNMKKYGFPNIEIPENEVVVAEHPSLFYKMLKRFLDQ